MKHWIHLKQAFLLHTLVLLLFTMGHGKEVSPYTKAKIHVQREGAMKYWKSSVFQEEYSELLKIGEAFSTIS
jgi:hypothetical protein